MISVQSDQIRYRDQSFVLFVDLERIMATGVFIALEQKFEQSGVLLKDLPDRVFGFLIEGVKLDQKGVWGDDALQGNSRRTAAMGQ